MSSQDVPRSNALEEWSFELTADGTTTFAALYVKVDDGAWTPFAEGIARRRKGDRRNQALGTSLAALRCFEHAVAVTAARVAEHSKSPKVVARERRAQIKAQPGAVEASRREEG